MKIILLLFGLFISCVGLAIFGPFPGQNAQTATTISGTISSGQVVGQIPSTQISGTFSANQIQWPLLAPSGSFSSPSYSFSSMPHNGIYLDGSNNLSIVHSNNMFIYNTTGVTQELQLSSGSVTVSVPFQLTGSSSGNIRINSTTGTYNFNMPTTVGSAGQALLSQGGGASAMTWTDIQNTDSAQTTLNGSAGTAVCSEPSQGTSYKKALCYLSGYTDTATQTYTFPTAFSHTPAAVFTTGGATLTTLSTTSLAITSTAVTGFVILEGF